MKQTIPWSLGSLAFQTNSHLVSQSSLSFQNKKISQLKDIKIKEFCDMRTPEAKEGTYPLSIGNSLLNEASNDETNWIPRFEETDTQYHAMTYNIEHPILKFVSGDLNPKRHAPIIAARCQENSVELINTQETTPHAFHSFQRVGYGAVSSDHFPLKSLDNSWRGLSSFFNESRFKLHDSIEPEFKRYHSDNQKNWPHVKEAFAQLIQAVVHPVSLKNVQKLMGDFICSFSGVARQDGLLLTPLWDKNNNQTVLLCNTHLESFDKKIRCLQKEEMISMIQELKCKHPDAIIILGGDFNQPLSERGDKNSISFSDQLHQVIGFETIPEYNITATHQNTQQAIDGLYILAPQNSSIKRTLGYTLNSSGMNKLSDHYPVVINADMRLG